MNTDPIRAPLPDVHDFLLAHPPPAVMPASPLRAGLHIWVWPGGHSEGWKSARFQAERILRLGGVGIIAQSGLGAPQWLEGRHAGESKPRVEILREAGLQVTACLGMDGHHPVAEVVAALVRAVIVADAGMLDHEAQTLWENRPGRAYARAIVEGVFEALSNLAGLPPDVMERVARALAGGLFADGDWWEPLSHLSSPALIFWLLALWKFVQAYGAKSRDNPNESTEWMFARSQRDYPQLGVPAGVVAPSEQMYGHSLKDAGILLFSGHPVIALWDVEEMDRIFEAAMLARFAIALSYGVAHPTQEHIVRLEQDEHLASVDAGYLGPQVLHALGIPVPL